MNYIKEINAFYQRQIEYQLRASEQALWHRLMAYCNVLDWQKEFSVPTQVLMNDLKLSRNDLNRVRIALVDCGLIEYNVRQGCKSGTYRMISFEERNEHHSESLADPFHASFAESFDESLDSSQTEDASLILIKQNQTKQNKGSGSRRASPP